jgi:hypothetical protein
LKKLVGKIVFCILMTNYFFNCSTVTKSTSTGCLIMAEHQYTQQPKKMDNTSQKQTIPPKQIPTSHPAAIIQRARINPKSLTHADVMQLQRTIGNRAVGRLLTEIGLIPSKTTQAPPVQMEPLPGEEEELLQRKTAETIQRQEIPEPEEEELLQGKFENKLEQEVCPSCSLLPIQREKENRTGMPDNLKAGVENLSGIDMSDVKVHYNSDKPAEVGALAYTQGTNIHIASGQEQHLPHEAWHVVQQAQGRVRPIMQLKDVAINDDEELEREADVLGLKSLQRIALGKDSMPIQFAFWHIDPGNAKKQMSREHMAMVERLKRNRNFVNEAKGIDQIDTTFDLADLDRAPPGGPEPDDLYVIAHGSQAGAGVDERQPWLGGLEFPDFAQKLLQRYGAKVENKTIWLMTCLVGGVLDRLAEQIARVGLKQVTIMAPNSFMFVSEKGIPHVYKGKPVEHEELDQQISRGNADWTRLSAAFPENWLDTGLGWSGIFIDSEGKINKIDKKQVIKMVLDKFDPPEESFSGEEWEGSGADYQGVSDLY